MRTAPLTQAFATTRLDAIVRPEDGELHTARGVLTPTGMVLRPGPRSCYRASSPGATTRIATCAFALTARRRWV